MQEVLTEAAEKVANQKNEKERYNCVNAGMSFFLLFVTNWYNISRK